MPCYTISPTDDSTLAIEITRTTFGQRKKQMLFFTQFSGELRFAENDLSAFQFSLAIDASSAERRDAGLKKKQRVGRDALRAAADAQIRFEANSISPKALRGFTMEGVLRVRDATRVVRVNMVLNPMRKDSLQLDGDATLRLSDFGIPVRNSLFGLIGTKDEALVRVLLWAIPRVGTVI